MIAPPMISRNAVDGTGIGGATIHVNTQRISTIDAQLHKNVADVAKCRKSLCPIKNATPNKKKQYIIAAVNAVSHANLTPRLKATTPMGTKQTNVKTPPICISVANITALTRTGTMT
jgi:hypothetical protein